MIQLLKLLVFLLNELRQRINREQDFADITSSSKQNNPRLSLSWQYLQWLSVRIFAYVSPPPASTFLLRPLSAAANSSPSVAPPMPISTQNSSVRISQEVRIITAKALVIKKRPSNSWIASTQVCYVFSFQVKTISLIGIQLKNLCLAYFYMYYI